MRVLIFILMGLPLLSQDYHGHIAPIIEDHCVSCHSPGKIGPMPLTNFDEVSSYGSMISFVTAQGLMPPGRVDYDYNSYKHENRLSRQEIEMISKWVQEGMPEGTPNALAPESAESEDNQGNWIEFSMAQSFEQYGIYYDQFHVFVIPNHTGRDLYIDAIEFVPGNASIVKWCTVSLETGSNSDSLERWDPRYGYNQFGGPGIETEDPLFYHWFAGKGATWLEDGIYREIPAEGRLLLHINYGPTPVEKNDSSGLRVRLTNPSPGEALLRSIGLLDTSHISYPPFLIKAGEETRVHAKRILEEDMTVYSIMPMGQLICRSWEVFVRHPESGVVTRLVKIPDWNFHWRRNYEFKDPVHLPAGTEIHAIASYDNTAYNLYNPAAPPTDIGYGYGMFQELFRVNAEIAQQVPDPEKSK